jgi:hypothetical protein
MRTGHEPLAVDAPEGLGVLEMASARLPVMRSSAKGNEADSSARPIKMIPPFAGVDPKEETELLLLDVAEHLHPGVNHYSELNKQARSHWLVLSSNILRESPDISQYLDTLGEVLARGVNAQIDDVLQRLEADLKEKARRSEEEERERAKREEREEENHDEHIANQRQQRTQREEEWAIRKVDLEQASARKKQRDSVGHILEIILIITVVISFLLAASLIVIGAAHGYSDVKALSLTVPGLTFVLGGGGATGLFSLSLVALHRMRRGHDETKDGPLPPSPAPGEAASASS